jgi:hypothetical protein
MHAHAHGFVHGQWVYTFDQSCQFHPKYYDLLHAFDEAIKMAAVARERLANPNNHITESLFDTIFKVRRSQEPRPYSELVHYYYYVN